MRVYTHTEYSLSSFASSFFHSFFSFLSLSLCLSFFAFFASRGRRHSSRIHPIHFFLCNSFSSFIFCFFSLFFYFYLSFSLDGGPPLFSNSFRSFLRIFRSFPPLPSIYLSWSLRFGETSTDFLFIDLGRSIDLCHSASVGRSPPPLDVSNYTRGGARSFTSASFRECFRRFKSNRGPTVMFQIRSCLCRRR